MGKVQSFGGPTASGVGSKCRCTRLEVKWAAGRLRLWEMCVSRHLLRRGRGCGSWLRRGRCALGCAVPGLSCLMASDPGSLMWGHRKSRKLLPFSSPKSKNVGSNPSQIFKNYLTFGLTCFCELVNFRNDLEDFRKASMSTLHS